jgi:hypothetical protein
MKDLFILILITAIISCISSKKNVQSVTRLEIIKTDSIRDHFVFKTRNELGNEIIVLAEKDKVSDCKPFKKYILADSIHQVSAIKNGKRYDLIGFNVSIIDDIQIRDSGELAKIIWNCNCFTDK